MSKYSNSDVPAMWAMGRAADSHTGNYSTDGKNLYSYRLCIGETTEDGQKLLHDYTSGGIQYYSQTTSCHVGKARQYADLLRTSKEIINLRKV